MGKRKRRSDYGQVQVSDRDIFAFTWIAQQYAIRLDALHLLLEHYNQGQGKQDTLTAHAIKKAVRRWRQAGWVEVKKIIAGDPRWLYLSKAGLAYFGLDFPYYTPSLSKLPHIHQANVVRLFIEARHGQAIAWHSERVLRKQRDKEDSRHLPDAEVVYQGTTIAIEVELSRKESGRLRAILNELKAEYGAAWYFVSQTCQDAVEEAVQQIPNHQYVFRVYSLSAIVGSLWRTTRT